MSGRIKFTSGEASLYHLPDLPFVVGRRAVAFCKPVVGVELNLLALSSAEQIVNRNTHTLSGDIPERNINRANGAEQRTGLPEPIEIAVELASNKINPARVFTD